MSRYRIEINHPTRGWCGVGPCYQSREIAKSWVSFVRAYWHCKTRIVKLGGEG